MFRKIFKKNVAIFVLLFVAAFLFLISGNKFLKASMGGEGLTISPPISELNLKPGETATEVIRLTNPTDRLIEVYPKVMNFGAKGEGGEPAFTEATDESAKYSLAKWIEISQGKIALTPEQVVEFKYQISIPKDAEPGGHYGVVFFATEPPKVSEDSSKVSIGSMVGSLILTKVPGTIIEKGNLESFSAPWFSFNSPVEFTTRVSNNGNIHFKPKGEIRIKDWAGKEIDSVKVNEELGNILPDSVRKFTSKWAPQQSWFFPIGRYKAELKLTYGESEKELTGNVYFWIIPLWFIILLVVIFVLLTFRLIRYLVKRKRRISKPGKVILR